MKNIILTVSLLIISFLSFAQIYTYDQSGRAIGITYSNGQEIGYQYDTSGNIVSVETTAQTEPEPPTPPTDPNPPSNSPPSDSGGGGAFSLELLALFLFLLIFQCIRQYRKQSL